MRMPLTQAQLNDAVPFGWYAAVKLTRGAGEVRRVVMVTPSAREAADVARETERGDVMSHEVMAGVGAVRFASWS